MGNKFNLEVFLINILVPQFIGLSSTFFAGNVSGKYEAFFKPPFSPPVFLFNAVWFVMLVLAGIASYLINRQTEKDCSTAKFYYTAMLGMYFLWNILFFGLEKRFFSFIWIAVMLAVLIKCFGEFKKINKAASFVFIPCIIWTAFAVYLTFGIWYLNA